MTTLTIRFWMRPRAVAIKPIVAPAGSAALHPAVCRLAELFTRSCRMADVASASVYASPCINFHDPAGAPTSQATIAAHPFPCRRIEPALPNRRAPGWLAPPACAAHITHSGTHAIVDERSQRSLSVPLEDGRPCLIFQVQAGAQNVPSHVPAPSGLPEGRTESGGSHVSQHGIHVARVTVRQGRAAPVTRSSPGQEQPWAGWSRTGAGVRALPGDRTASPCARGGAGSAGLRWRR